MNGHASSLAAFCDHFSSSKQTFRRLGFRHSRQDLVKTSPANECPRMNLLSILSFSLRYSFLSRRHLNRRIYVHIIVERSRWAPFNFSWSKVRSLRTGSQPGRKKFGERSEWESERRDSTSEDRSRLVPPALDYTRLSRPKPNREPVRRLQSPQPWSRHEARNVPWLQQTFVGEKDCVICPKNFCVGGYIVIAKCLIALLEAVFFFVFHDAWR